MLDNLIELPGEKKHVYFNSNAVITLSMYLKTIHIAG